MYSQIKYYHMQVTSEEQIIDEMEQEIERLNQKILSRVEVISMYEETIDKHNDLLDHLVESFRNLMEEYSSHLTTIEKIKNLPKITKWILRIPKELN